MKKQMTELCINNVHLTRILLYNKSPNKKKLLLSVESFIELCTNMLNVLEA